MHIPIDSVRLMTMSYHGLKNNTHADSGYPLHSGVFQEMSLDSINTVLGLRRNSAAESMHASEQTANYILHEMSS